jgi:hypothetical protein
MSPQLRDGLHAAADAAGVSVNAFAVQVLATAVGDPARFRAAIDDAPKEPAELKRDHRGYPTRPRDRDIHMAARNHFMTETEKLLGAAEMFRLAKQYDAEDPGYYVEWERSRKAVS